MASQDRSIAKAQLQAESGQGHCKSSAGAGCWIAGLSDKLGREEISALIAKADSSQVRCLEAEAAKELESAAKLALLEEAEKRLSVHSSALCRGLKSNNQSFLQLAVRPSSTEACVHDLEARRSAIDQLVKPLKRLSRRSTPGSWRWRKSAEWHMQAP